jgi:hypothetical protein
MSEVHHMSQVVLETVAIVSKQLVSCVFDNSNSRHTPVGVLLAGSAVHMPSSQHLSAHTAALC